MILFLDLETTGLDTAKDHILEVGAIITDDNFDTQWTYESVVCWDASSGQQIDAKVVAMHARSGLWPLVLAPEAPTMDQVESALAAKLTPELAPGELVQLAGNSVWFDRAFLMRLMPRVAALLHHRQIDVSSLNEMARRVWPEEYNTRPQDMNHRALQDASVSLATARHYASRLLRVTPAAPAARARIGDRVRILICEQAPHLQGTIGALHIDDHSIVRPYGVMLDEYDRVFGYTAWVQSLEIISPSGGAGPAARQG